MKELGWGGANINEINMFRALTKDLDLNEILDLLADNHIDTAHVCLEPPENSDCSAGI